MLDILQHFYYEAFPGNHYVWFHAIAAMFFLKIWRDNLKIVFFIGLGWELIELFYETVFYEGVRIAYGSYFNYTADVFGDLFIILIVWIINKIH